jgi:hypothetical protein
MHATTHATRQAHSAGELLACTHTEGNACTQLLLLLLTHPHPHPHRQQQQQQHYHPDLTRAVAVWCCAVAVGRAERRDIPTAATTTDCGTRFRNCGTGGRTLRAPPTRPSCKARPLFVGLVGPRNRSQLLVPASREACVRAAEHSCGALCSAYSRLRFAFEPHFERRVHPLRSRPRPTNKPTRNTTPLARLCAGEITALYDKLARSKREVALWKRKVLLGEAEQQHDAK